jgi:hypothetical protein
MTAIDETADTSIQADGLAPVIEISDVWKLHKLGDEVVRALVAAEGITLHEITYTDRGDIRPIIYRASLSEMVVPYGDTEPTHWNKNVFDMGAKWEWAFRPTR